MTNIIGVGTDIVSVARIQRLVQCYPLRFPQKILHPDEHIYYAQNKYKIAFLAKRFAAKEAVAKALGLGFSMPLYAAKIFIYHDSNGQPQVKLPATLSDMSYNVQVSIADENEYAIAYAIVIKEG